MKIRANDKLGREGGGAEGWPCGGGMGRNLGEVGFGGGRETPLRFAGSYAAYP